MAILPMSDPTQPMKQAPAQQNTRQYRMNIGKSGTLLTDRTDDDGFFTP